MLGFRDDQLRLHQSCVSPLKVFVLPVKLELKRPKKEFRLLQRSKELTGGFRRAPDQERQLQFDLAEPAGGFLPSRAWSRAVPAFFSGLPDV